MLDGETLRERLAPAGAPVGGVPARKAVEIAIQIARGLAAAHEKGIVHRDLKPENVFLTTDGQIKLLDFGLAKVVAHESAAIGATATAVAATDPGTVMGTAGYMAPEQVRGSAVDARKAGFGAAVIEDACRGIDVGGSLAKAWTDMQAAGVRRVQSSELAV